MSLSRVIYTKDWNKPSDFPTIETSEAQVRADIQELYNQVRSAVNLIVDELESTLEISGASQIGLAAVDGVAATNLQTAIAELKTAIGSTGSTASANLTEHKQDKNNPHEVTASQVEVSVTGVTASQVEAAIAELKGILDTKAAQSLLANYETVASAKNHFVDVGLDIKTGVLTFTKESGETKTVDTALEEIPTTMKFYEQTEGGKSVYYLGIYNADDELISSVNVSSLFNEIEPATTDTIKLSTTVDSKGVKSISGQIVTGAITATHLSDELKRYIGTLEDLAKKVPANGYKTTDTVKLLTETGANGEVLSVSAEVRDHSIGAAQIDETYLEGLEELKEATETAASNASASEKNANDYQGKAKSYAIGDETTRPGSSTDNALYYKDQALDSAKMSESYAKGGTGARTGEDTDNAKYYKEQTAADKKSTAGYSEAAAGSATEAVNKAVLAESYTKGGTNTRLGEDTDNSKYYMEQAQIAAMQASGFDYEGGWDSSKVYTPAQIVSYDATVWVSKTNNVNSMPYEGSPDWSIFIGVPSVLDLGSFTDDTLVAHIANLNSHSTMTIDANNAAITTEETLEEHEVSVTAHGNINIDGGEI